MQTKVKKILNEMLRFSLLISYFEHWSLLYVLCLYSTWNFSQNKSYMWNKYRVLTRDTYYRLEIILSLVRMKLVLYQALAESKRIWLTYYLCACHGSKSPLLFCSRNISTHIQLHPFNQVFLETENALG